MKLEDFTKQVATNCKGKWVNSTHPVEINGQTYIVGIKAFENWAQIVQIDNIKSTVPQCKSGKQFREKLEQVLKSLAKAADMAKI